MLNPRKIKKDFPIFKYQPDLVYLDSAATSLKPKVVLEKIEEYYQRYCANVFRGIYKISERATEEYEKTRDKVANFIGARETKEIIFTRNTTESINLLAYTLGQKVISKGDEILVSIMEHHSNFVPWQQLAKNKGAQFKILDIDQEGRLKIWELENLISKRTKILALTFVSNVLGTINPIKKIIKMAKELNPKLITIVDAAQAVGHFPINVQDLGCDFLVFSSHKILGPTGVGVLWGKREILENLPPFNFGGEMVEKVTIKKTIFKELPHRFEAGTPNVADVIGFQAALDYLSKIGFKEIKEHDNNLTSFGLQLLKEKFQNKIKVLGPENPKDKIGIISFNLLKAHPHDVSQILDRDQICIRAGHHCALPLHQRLKLTASCRASFYIYNQREDIEKLVLGLEKIVKFLKI